MYGMLRIHTKISALSLILIFLQGDEKKKIFCIYLYKNGFTIQFYIKIYI